MAERTRARAIITFTHSGYTALQIARHRPDVDIFAFTDNKRIIPKLSLVWGVRAFHTQVFDDIDKYIEFSIRFLKDRNLIQDDDTIVHIGSTPILERGKTNLLKLSYV
jgi:pyruvate kinase